MELIINHFKVQPYLRYMKKQKGCQIIFTHQLLSEMLSKEFYINNEHYSDTKKIPQWINNIGEKNIIDNLC